jgi:hypothetical protein
MIQYLPLKFKKLIGQAENLAMIGNMKDAEALQMQAFLNIVFIVLTSGRAIF